MQDPPTPPPPLTLCRVRYRIQYVTCICTLHKFGNGLKRVKCLFADIQYLRCMRIPECFLYFGCKFIVSGNQLIIPIPVPSDIRAKYMMNLHKYPRINYFIYLGSKIYIHLQLTPPLSFLPLQLNNNNLL
jgi:hypothetical protein